MTNSWNSPIAGRIQAQCQCCAQAVELMARDDLDWTRRYCPNTHLTYLDRGDGLFEADGQHLALQSAQPSLASHASVGPNAASILSDRPAKTDAKTRIELERATFAGRLR